MSFGITGLVIAKNEEHDLPQALASWEPVCEQMVVVDDASSDHTREIARAHGAKVVDVCMDDETGYAGIRNAGLETVETSHVLVFDADERPSGRVLQSIGDAARERRPTAAYRFLRRNHAFGGWLDHGRFSPDWQIRLFSSDVRYEGLVHELPILEPEVQIYDLAGTVEHFTYKSLGEYLSKMRCYAEKQSQHQKAPTITDVIKVLPANLILRKGYKDGWRGLAMAVGDVWHEDMLRRYGLHNEKHAQALDPTGQAAGELGYRRVHGA